MNIPSQISTLLAGIVITLVSLWYGQNHNLFPVAASDEAPLIDNLFNFMMTIGTGIFILVQGVLIWVALRYNRKPNAEVVDGSPDHGNIPLEIVWTAIPAVIMLILSIYSFDVYQQIGGLNPMGHEAHMTQTAAKPNMPGAAMAATMDMPTAMPTSMSAGSTQSDSVANAGDKGLAKLAQVDITPAKDPDNAFNVNVSAMQFAWLFEYPGEDVTTGELHVPIGRDVVVSMVANDVIHAFWVPEFRIKQDAVPGITTTVRFTPSRLGEYPLICAELCGAYHGIMRSKVIVESEADYRTWIEGQKLAQAGELRTRVATAQMSDTEYLQPYAKDMAVTPEMLKGLASESANHAHHGHTMATSAS